MSERRDDELIAWVRKNEPEMVSDLDRLRRLLTVVDAYHRDRWRRHVSAGDGVIDRWERARSLGFGEGASIYDSALVIGDVRVGRNTWVGPQTVLDGSGGLTIGDHCSISAGVQIYSHDTIRWALSGGAAQPERAPTAICSDTYLGPNTVVGKGVTIGSRCIVGAGSLVLEDVPDGRIAYGTPAAVAGTVEDYLARKEGSPSRL